MPLPLPARNILDGTKTPATTTSEMKTALGQVRDFLNEILQYSAASSGYQKLPSGIIIQWGYGTTAGSGGVALTFPVAFPTACLSVTATPVNGGLTAVSVVVAAYSRFSTTVYAATPATAGVAIGVGYIAIGW